MSIRSEAMPYRGGISRQLQDLLRRNGMNAQVAVENDKLLLLVQSHDSPLLQYQLSEKQFRALADGGTNFANKNAYRTFNSIVGSDFDLPSSYVAARNVNGRVAMGLHGYRERYGGYGANAFGPGFLGWTPRMQDGFHLRRMGGAVMMPEHSDGMLRPGELRSGGYGYYYKGDNDQRQRQQAQADPLQDLKVYFPPVETRPRQTEPSKSYSELITSPVYFTNEKWKEVLDSHGILIDADNKTLTIQSSKVPEDLVYDLTDEEVKKLTSNSLNEVSLEDRIGILNKVIGNDFKDAITLELLNGKEAIAINLKPEVAAEIRGQAPMLQHEAIGNPMAEQHYAPTLDPEKGYVNGQDLQYMDSGKGWYREGTHGREVSVGDIWVSKEPKPVDEDKQKKDKGKEKESDNGKGKPKEPEMIYKMSAVINGEVITHEISKKQYDKFMAVDDFQRQRMMSKIFKEVDMKDRPGERQGFNVGAFLGAGLTALSEAAYIGADIAHSVDRIRNPHPSPEMFREAHGTARIYAKPGVDSPQDIAERAFEAGLNAGLGNGEMGRGR